VGAIGRIFGRGRAIENILKKAEDSFGKGEWDNSAHFASDVRAKINLQNPGKHSIELLRAYYLEIASHYKNGELDAALPLIDEAFNQPEGLGDIAKLLSEIAAEHSEPGVVKILERAVKKLPDNNHIALALCYIYIDMEHFDEDTTPLFRRMYKRVPDNSKIVFGLAMTLQKQKKYDRTSLGIYRRAFHDYSTNQDILYALARTYASQSPPVSEALPVIERALKFFPDEDSFQKAKILILANLPSLTENQVTILVENYKKTRDEQLASKLVNHLLASHADDEDACRVYEAVWHDHQKKITLLSILAERYRVANRRDKDAMEVFQAFFDEMPRERENTIYLARRYAENSDGSETAILVYQQALKDRGTANLDNVVIALANAFLALKKTSEDAARVFRMAHVLEPENFSYLLAIKDAALSGGRMDGERADPVIEYINHPDASKKTALAISQKLGPILAKDGRNDNAARSVYSLNVEYKISSEDEEKLLVDALVREKDAKLRDIPLLERVYERRQTDDLALVLTGIYSETGEPSEKRLPVVIKALQKDPANRKIAGWALPFMLNHHGQDDSYFPLFADLISKGHLAAAKGIKSGVLASTATRIARDRIREAKYPEAVNILGEAFKFEKSPIVQYLLGVSYQGAGDYKTGLEIFRDLLKSDKQNVAYAYRVAVLKLLSGDIKGAIKDLNDLTKRSPDHPMLHLRMGMVSELEGKPDDALAEYEKITSGDNSILAFADYRKGIIYCTMGEWEKGLKSLERASGGGVTSPALENARLRARLTLADIDIQNNALDSAERRLMKICAYKVHPWPMLASERLLRLALHHLDKNKSEPARRLIEAAVSTNVRDARTSSLLAMLDISSGRPKAALERLESVLNLRDKVGAELAHRIWCVICLKLGRHDDARDASEWLLAHKSEDAPKFRFLAVWRDPVVVDWPPAVENFTYDNLETEIGFPVGLIGRMAYKRADYAGGAKFLEKYYKDESKPDRIEAEFLLGLMYIKQKKPNLGLHYWSHILTEGHRALPENQRVDNLTLLGYHFLEHGEADKCREAFRLAQEAGASKEEIKRAVAFSHLHAGFLAAKTDNMQSAIREWEIILESDPDNWQALQNLGIAYFWINDDAKSMFYFDKLYTICEHSPELIDDENYTFIFEETRKMINQLVSFTQTSRARVEVKREMLLDEIQSANRHYWTLNVKKGITSLEAQADYFRLVKIYNPEKYPRDFMVLEKAYEFFNKPGLLKKNEQMVFNSFHFRFLSLEEAGGLSEIPPSPQIVDYLRNQLDPNKQVNFTRLLEDSLGRQDVIPELDTTPDLNVPDYLASW